MIVCLCCLSVCVFVYLDVVLFGCVPVVSSACVLMYVFVLMHVCVFVFVHLFVCVGVFACVR